MPFSFQPPLHQILSLSLFFFSHPSILFFSLLLSANPLPDSLPTAHFLSHKSQPPLFRVQPSSSLTAAHAAPHLGLPTPASTRRPFYAGLNMPVSTRRPNLLILTESRWPSLSLSLSLFNFSIISSLFYILGLFNILFQFLCANKVRVLKKPMCLVVYILGLFIFLISSLCLIFWVCLFFSLFAFLENKW